MNSLAKLQVLMTAFLFLITFAFLLEPLLLIPAAALFLLQFPIARGEFARDYPEDWKKYAFVFIAYEAVFLVLILVIKSVPLSAMDFGSMYTVFGLVMVIILMTIALKYFVGRRYCYGTVLFSTKGWVGVHVKNDLFSRVREADYAVSNPRGMAVAKGERVKLRIAAGLGSSAPAELAGVSGFAAVKKKRRR